MRTRFCLAVALFALLPTVAMARDLATITITNESPVPFTISFNYSKHDLRVLPQDQYSPDSVVVPGWGQVTQNINNGFWDVSGGAGQEVSFMVNKGKNYELVLYPFHQDGVIGMAGVVDDGYNEKVVVLYQQRTRHRPSPRRSDYPYGGSYRPDPGFHDPRLSPGEKMGVSLGDAFADLIIGLFDGSVNRPDHRPGNNRPGQGGPGGYDRPDQGRPGSDHGGRPGQDRPGQDRPGQNRPGNDRPGQDRPGQNRPDQDRPPVYGGHGPQRRW